jgi:DNA-directed RNA polymerase specialized sigma24 family protein
VPGLERSGNRLCETAFWLCRDWSLAQDLTQTTLIKVYLSWRRIKRDDPYRYCKRVLLRDRAIVVLRYWEDHSVQTVAELLGLSPGVVKVQSMRALASLRVLLDEDEALPAPPV